MNPYRNDIIHDMMLNINWFPCLETRGPMKRKAHLEELFQLVPIQGVSIPSVTIETNQNNINLEGHLKWNLQNAPNAFL
jgi:hypothetical protein